MNADEILNLILQQTPAFHTDREGRLAAHRLGEPAARFLVSHVRPGHATLETGAGVSTVLFAACGAAHTAVLPYPEEVDRIRDYCQALGIDLSKTDFVVGASEKALPALALPPLDFVLIDGCHGFPAPFIDWHYSSLALKVGGLLLVDDTQLWTGGVLRAYLRSDPDWEFVADLGKTSAFRKRRHVRHVKEWAHQPWTGNWPVPDSPPPPS